MLIPLDNGKNVDTDRDLSSAERHVLQKLFGWKTLVTSVHEFRKKTKLALHTGWNNSGPLRASHSLNAVVQQLEKEITNRGSTNSKQQ